MAVELFPERQADKRYVRHNACQAHQHPGDQLLSTAQQQPGADVCFSRFASLPCKQVWVQCKILCIASFAMKACFSAKLHPWCHQVGVDQWPQSLVSHLLYSCSQKTAHFPVLNMDRPTISKLRPQCHALNSRLIGGLHCSDVALPRAELLFACTRPIQQRRICPGAV